MAQPARVALWAAWTLYMLYYFVVFVPEKSPFFVWILGVTTRLHLPQYTAAKTFHVVSFTIWTVLLAWVLARGAAALGRPRWRALLAAALAFSVLPEGLQALNPKREPALTDILFNLSGVAIAVAGRRWREDIPPFGGRDRGML